MPGTHKNTEAARPPTNTHPRTRDNEASQRRPTAAIEAKSNARQDLQSTHTRAKEGKSKSRRSTNKETSDNSNTNPRHIAKHTPDNPDTLLRGSKKNIAKPSKLSNPTRYQLRRTPRKTSKNTGTLSNDERERERGIILVLPPFPLYLIINKASREKSSANDVTREIQSLKGGGTLRPTEAQEQQDPESSSDHETNRTVRPA